MKSMPELLKKKFQVPQEEVDKMWLNNPLLRMLQKSALSADQKSSTLEAATNVTTADGANANSRED